MFMTVITAPEALPEYDGGGLFIAGGISGCPDWQKGIVSKLDGIPVDLFNPRRNIYSTTAGVAETQIEWEFHALNKAEAVMFWFPMETLCPITLFELGRFSHERTKTLFVGVHPNYQRKLDVETQLRLARPEIIIVDNKNALVQQIRNYYAS